MGHHAAEQDTHQPQVSIRRRAVRVGALASAAAIGLVLTGCTADEAPDAGATGDQTSASAGGPQPSSAPTDAGSATSAASSAPAQEQNAALLAAGETALGELPDAFVVSIDSERRDTVWEVDVVIPGGDERSMIISGDGTTVESGPTGGQDDAEDRAENLRKTGAGTDYRQAAAAIEDARPGRIAELNLDDDDSGLVWEADVRVDGSKYDVHVDAASGEVTSNREDRDG